MEGGSADDSYQAACAMLETFTATGAQYFDLTINNLQGKKIHFRAHVSASDLRQRLPALLRDGIAQQHNIIIRPHGTEMQFIQLDDLAAIQVERIKEYAFLALETSPGNHQAWIALRKADSDQDKDLARRVRKAIGADPSASGATRIAGHPNFKEKYAPAFPSVRMCHSAPGLIANCEQLIRSRCVAPAAPTPAISLSTPSRRPGPGMRKWPSYARCLQGAPPNHAGDGPDVSRADFTWCMTAISWEWSIEETAARLLEESPKAKENGERYALLTAQNAAAAVLRRQTSQRG